MLEHDIYCICGRCGTKLCGVRQWIALSIEILQGWPTFSYVAVGAFLPRRQRKAEAKACRQERKKGTVFVVPRSSGVAIVPDPTHVDSSAEYVPPRDVSGAEGSTQRTPNAPSLHEQRSCTGASWLMLRFQQILIPSQMQGHAVVVTVTVAVAVAVVGAVGVAGAVAVVVALMQQTVPSPLAVPMWRRPLLLHQLRKNFAGQECAQANAQLGHCLPPPLMLMQNPVLPQYPIS